MKLKLISIAVAGLFVSPAVGYAQDTGLKWSGSVSGGLRSTRENAPDASKLNEYRDLGSGAGLLIIDARGRSDSSYVNVFGENIGRDDMFLDLRGGKYGAYKYQLYSNELRHNFGSGVGARTPFSNPGDANLTGTFPNTNANSWSTFDHSYERRDWGGMVEFATASPWYFRAEVNEVQRKGINVFAGALGTSPGNGSMDLPTPIDYSTKNYTAEAGYSVRTGHFAINAMYSDFSNANQRLTWRNPYFGGTDTTPLAPDNNYWRWSANGNLRQLPWDSTLAGRVTMSKLTNSVSVLSNILSDATGGAVVPINAATGSNNSTFNGQIVKKSLSLSLASHPTKDLDTRAYMNWMREDNRSTRMQFAPAATVSLLGGAAPNCSTAGTASVPGPVPCTPEPFDERKLNLGVEAGYKVNQKNKLSGGFDWYDVERERFDIHGNLDKKIFLEWKSNTFEMLTSRLKYQRLQRNTQWNVDRTVYEANPTEYYVRRYDLADLKQHMFKLVLDATPMAFLDLGLEAIVKRNDWFNTPLGRKEDERKELYASVSYGDPDKFRMMLFGDIEWMQYLSTHRAGGTTLANSNPDAAASGGPPSTIYTWDAKNRDRSWQVGLGADWVPMEKLTVKSSLVYARTKGGVDFQAKGNAVIAAPGFLSIGNFDNTKRTSLNVKGVYRYTKQWEWTGGYAYERYRYSDIGYDNLTYTAGPAAASPGATTSYYTGQFAFQPYKANIVYLLATYKF